MVANQVKMECEPDALVFDMLGRMEALAANSEWDRTERLAAGLRSAVLDVPENLRAEVLAAVSQSLQRVQTAALASRANVSEKLGEIRRGKDAARAYGQSQVNEATATLR